MTAKQMLFVRNAAKQAARKGLRGKALQKVVRDKVIQEWPDIDWEKVLEFLKVILPLILALFA